MKKNTCFCIILILLSFAAALSTCVLASTRNSLNWEGRYAGRIPAADCPGIDVQITLRSDKTFSLIYDYVDRDGFTSNMGEFEWDVTGNVIILKNTHFPSYYRVEKDRLRQLDMEGNEITGNLAQMYVLNKVK